MDLFTIPLVFLPVCLRTALMYVEQFDFLIGPTCVIDESYRVVTLFYCGNVNLPLR